MKLPLKHYRYGFRSLFRRAIATGATRMKPPDKERIQDTDDSLDGFLESPIFRLNPMFDRLEGTTLDRRYVVERELGHTTMSQVYLARALRLQGQRVVIKILSAAL